jgi:hypothetical protein
VRLRRLNCWLYTGWLIFRLKGRLTFFVKRVGPGGAIPHAGVIQQKGQNLTFIEYKAVTRKRFFFDRSGSNVLWFKGKVRVRRYRLVGEGWGDTLEEAQAAMPPATFLINDGGPEYDAHMG